jgi:flagella basal body P-ring formation protein FlgA
MTAQLAANRTDALPSTRIRARTAIALLVSALCGAGGVAAAAPDLAGQTRVFLDREALSLPGDVEIEVGEPDSRMNLAQCSRFEPFVPAGARLWGRTMLGVRCVEGATWSVFIPVRIKVFAPMPVAARSIGRGQPLGAEDVRIERVEVTQWPPGTLATQDQLDGRLATRSIVAGEPFRRDSLRSVPVITAGDPVTVVFSGASFTISTEGRSVASAGDGQAVQVALTGGRILSGIARPGKMVEVR